MKRTHWLNWMIITLLAACLLVSGTVLAEGAAPEQDAKLAPYRTVGSIVTFGHYEQDNNPENGAEEIEWIVQQVSGNKVNLISRCTLDMMKYHSFQRMPLTWEECDLRKWLNSDFFEAAFNSSEQDAILVTTVKNGDEGRSEPSTEDRVYIPSYADNGYRGSCPASERVRAKDKDASYYWALRRTVTRDFGIANVTNRGAIIGRIVYRSSLLQQAIRPEIWVDMNSNYFTQ